jgi:uncharacterized RDD family membrane protein YckC
VVVFIYHSLLEGLIGTTPGKAMMSLRVDAIGERGRFVGAMLRNVLRIVDSILLYLVGFLVAMFTTKRQRVGDLAGGTVVMETRSRNLLRAGLMIVWLLAVSALLWMAETTCPTCTFDDGWLRRFGLIR